MKIVCDNCSTKYSIADEKVRGKVFKIKCKKCSHIIVVKGAEGGAEAEGGAPAAGGFDQKETRVFDYAGGGGADTNGAAAAAGGDAVWYLVIDREQVGPLSVAEIQDKFGRREIDSDTYGWREGFGDWQRIGNIPDMAHFAAGGEAAAASGGDGLFGGEAMSGPTNRADPADLFASAGGGTGEEEGGGDLFGGRPAGAEAEAAVFSSAGGRRTVPKDDLFAAAPAGGGGGGMEMSAGGGGDIRPMTGQRNENSVLFSLSNLASLATETKAPSSSSAAAAPKSGPGGDGSSGLIDIRAMAAMTLGGKKESSSSSSNADDDLPVFSPSSFAAPTAGVLLPQAAPAANTKILYVLIGVVGFLALAAIVLVIFLVKGSGKSDDSSSDKAVAAAGAPGEMDKDKDKAEGKPAGSETATPPGGAMGATPPAGAATPPAGGTPAPGVTPAPKPERDRDRDKPRDRGSKPAADKPSREEAAPAPAPTPKPAKGNAPCDEVACLVDSSQPCCKSGNSPSPSPSKPSGGGGGDGPETLDKSAIQAGISSVRGRVMSCNDQYKVPGQVDVKIVISADGDVSSASVTGKFAGTPTGSCVERAIKSAHFKSAQKSTTVKYPFIFR
jgi:predicted Zn finger-like uncharacterized protein